MQGESDPTRTTSGLADWLEPLRRHSWEMELLLTGFVLIGLFQLPDYLEHLEQLWRMRLEGDSVFESLTVTLPVRILTAGVRIMTINLIVLLLLRGFWIGMIGLSSAFPRGVNHERLSFSDRFDRYLREQSMDTESTIVRLDNVCSSLFALSFLVVFVVVSGGLYLVQIQIWSDLTDMTQAGDSVLSLLANILVFLITVFYVVAGLLKVIDFLSVGVLKRIKAEWFARPYFFISRFVSYVTLGFLYRRIYYALASNLPKRIIGLALAVYLIITVAIVFGFDYHAHPYYPSAHVGQSNRDRYEVRNKHYENLRSEGDVIQNSMIQSDVISGRYLKLFIPYDVDDHAKLRAHCPELRNIGWQFNAMMFRHINFESQIKTALECFSGYYTVAVDDSLCTDLRFFFFRPSQENSPGIRTYIPVDKLAPGHHTVTVMELGEEIDRINFWKE